MHAILGRVDDFSEVNDSLPTYARPSSGQERDLSSLDPQPPDGRAKSAASDSSGEFACAPFRFRIQSKRIWRDSVEIRLTDTEFDLAVLLMRNLGRPLSRSDLIDPDHQSGSMQSRALDTHMSRLRTKLRLKPQCGFVLTSARPIGYRLERVDMPERSEVQRRDPH